MEYTINLLCINHDIQYQLLQKKNIYIYIYKYKLSLDLILIIIR